MNKNFLTEVNFAKHFEFSRFVISNLIPCPASSNEINPFQASVTFNIETSHLFSRANQMTSLYMKWVNEKLKKILILFHKDIHDDLS